MGEDNVIVADHSPASRVGLCEEPIQIFESTAGTHRCRARSERWMDSVESVERRGPAK
jgi:hypothetical protein